MSAGRVVLVIVFSYLLGAVPFGLLFSKLVMGEDVRSQGSGNIGATNVGRNYGWFAGILTFFLDYLKGAIPVLMVLYLYDGTHLELVATLSGVATVIGHLYPIFLFFDGGKGVATSAGVFTILTPVALAVAVLFFLFGLTSRYMAIASLSGALALGLSAVVVYGLVEPGTVAAILLALLVVYSHRSNIVRLLQGEEHRLY